MTHLNAFAIGLLTVALVESIRYRSAGWAAFNTAMILFNLAYIVAFS